MLRLFFALLFLPLRLIVFAFYRLTLLKRRSILHLHVPDRFTLFESSGWMSRFVGQEKQGITYFPFLFLLRRIRKSKDLQQLILEIPPGFESALNWSQIFDIAAELDRIRQAGIRIVAHASGGGLQTLLLLSRADLRLIAPGVMFLTALPHRESFYYAGLLDQIGLQIEVYHAGKFKSAGESLSRTGSSSAARENMTTLLERMRALILERFEQTPALDPASYTRFKRLLLSQSICNAEDLLNSSFVNAVVESRRLLAYIATGRTEQPRLEHRFIGPGDEKPAPLVEDDHTADLTLFEKRTMDAGLFLKRERRRLYRPFRLKRPPSIAITTLHGTIVQGRTGDSARAGSVVAQAWKELFRELEEGPDRAVILYVDSPGGLSDASEQLYQQIRDLSRVKPVFAYFGGVAASGGYYLACAANRIHASPVSLTGSIGVIRFRPQASALLKKLQIRSERLLFDDTTDLLSPTAKPGRKSRKLLEASTASAYMDFMKRVAEGRGLSAEKVLAAAGGRVYVADELKGSGLIDSTTDLISLIESFRKESGMKEEQPLDVRLLPELQIDLRAMIRSGLPLTESHIAGLSGLLNLVPGAGTLLKQLIASPGEIVHAMVSGLPMMLAPSVSTCMHETDAPQLTQQSGPRRSNPVGRALHLFARLFERRYPF
ncbi:S49 family peptidase [Leptonema illini]|uniref:Peptidase S49 n=1 Tax=Leptonema illini DSM 21528 TaxID=929563 RepID=H2CJ43_9LEPT|nr:S49 family peptidase [Leptonema illini]EHQ04960.1 peptidase S49 [Leptonema illini DSM 21528]